MTTNASNKPNPTPSGWVLAQHGGAVEPITQYCYSSEFWLERTRDWDNDRDWNMDERSLN